MNARLRDNVYMLSSDTSMYWSRGRNQPPATNSWFYRAAPSAEVEMTAYALMSYLKFYRKKGVQMSSKIAVWLTRQRNAFGGFASTQVGKPTYSFPIGKWEEKEEHIFISIFPFGVYICPSTLSFIFL